MTLLDGNRSSLKRGEYAFKAGVSLREVEAQLIAHKVVQHKLTIPEGLTSDQVVERLRDDDVLVGEVKEPPREGSLLPDTYLFERGDTRQAELTRMAKAQAKVVDEIWAKRAPDLPIKSPGELVTLASIVEKETGKADERPRVAGVFVNRLQKHMRLQSDPTIVYGLVFGKGTLGHPITKAELDQPTPYNTYNIDGLPPGPICNPGKAALEAVANPAADEGTLFRRRRNRRPRLRRDARPASEERRALAADRKGRQGQARARRDADARSDADAGQARRARRRRSGDLRRCRARRRAGRQRRRWRRGSASSAENRKARGALLGPGRRAVGGPRRGASLDTLGAVVTGVNDEPPTQAFPDDPTPDGAGAAGPVGSAFGGGARRPEGAHRPLRRRRRPPIRASPGSTRPPARPARPRAFDASEGTPLDPLLNKTYDLNYAKAVPTFD